MRNLFVGGSSEIAREIAKSIKNTDSEHKKNVGYLSENNPLYMDFYIRVGRMNLFFNNLIQGYGL